MSEQPKRRWFQMSLREAALVVLALGLALAWYRERAMWEPVRKIVHYAVDDSKRHPTSSYDPQTDCEIDGIPVTVSVLMPTDLHMIIYGRNTHPEPDADSTK